MTPRPPSSQATSRRTTSNDREQPNAAPLHPGLVSPLAHKVLEIAERHGAAGGKVNGAGGQGGPVSIVGPDDPGELLTSLASMARLTVLPLRPARQGVRIVEHS